MEDKYPCMHLECDDKAIYGIECNDDLGGTLVCEKHLELIREKDYFKKSYRLDEM